MSIQVRVRRDTAGNLATVIPADGEMAYNTTDDRLHMGDGATTGGIPHLNYRDDIKQYFHYATTTGSSNAYILTLPSTPVSITAGTRVKFKASFSNTGSATLAVNGFTAYTFKKVVSGALTVLSSADIISGLIYEAVFDGTDWQLFGFEMAGTPAGIVLLGSVTASASATLDFTSLISSLYDRYTFVLKDLRFANAIAQALWMRTSTNNGTTYDSAANAYGGVYRTRLYGGNPPTTTEVGQTAGATEIILGISGGNASTSVICGMVDLFNPLGSVAYKRVIYQTIGGVQATERHYEGSSTRKSTAAIDAVRFMSASGNITSGEIDMYGWRA